LLQQRNMLKEIKNTRFRTYPLQATFL
jgi:hypothetical protein